MCQNQIPALALTEQTWGNLSNLFINSAGTFENLLCAEDCKALKLFIGQWGLGIDCDLCRTSLPKPQLTMEAPEKAVQVPLPT